ncbi:MAG TPA: hypothetical protein VFC31_01320 [Candidatus Limnocylindria bacterium]|nr:hypothetical protein [Candidatus Limnocylindria bacterium]
MKVLALLAAVIASACTTTAVSAPASAPAAGGGKDITILAGDGAVMRPIANGGRVPLRSGWATITLSPVPLAETGQLRVSVFDAEGRQTEADVFVDYASIDMDHGHTVEHGVLRENCYQMPLSFAMPGSWRLMIHVVRGATDETVTVVLPEVGL